jgi:hypothetical protein
VYKLKNLLYKFLSEIDSSVSTETTKKYGFKKLLQNFNYKGIYDITQEPGSSVSTITELQAERPGFDSRKGQKFFSSPPRPDRH